MRASLILAGVLSLFGGRAVAATEEARPVTVSASKQQCQRGCNQRCHGARNKAKCVAQCRRACR